MKKITLITCLVVSTLYLFAGTVKTEGSLGAPSRGCKGMGVCKSTTTTSDMAQPMSMTWELTDAQDYLYLHLRKSDLQTYAHEQYAELEGRSMVLFEDPTIVDASICSTLGLGDEEIQIPAGEFQIQDAGDEFIIVFPLTD